MSPWSVSHLVSLVPWFILGESLVSQPLGQSLVSQPLGQSLVSQPFGQSSPLVNP